MTQNKKLTPKQVQTKADQLLKKIDGNNDAIAKKLNENVQVSKQVKTLITSATSVAISTPVKATQETTPKPAKVAKTASKAKNGAEPKAKVVKAAKPAKEAQTKGAVKPPKAAKPAKIAKTASNRPPLKDLVGSILTKNGKPMGASDIWHAGPEDHKYSRQSLYNLLKDERSFTKIGDEYKLVVSSISIKNDKHSEEEADKFVQSVEGNQTVSSVS